MDTKISFLYLSEPDMIKAGVTDMPRCVEVMEDLLLTLNRGDYVMGGTNHNSHGTQISFPDHRRFPTCPSPDPTAALWPCRHIWEEIIRWQV